MKLIPLFFFINIKKEKKKASTHKIVTQYTQHVVQALDNTLPVNAGRLLCYYIGVNAPRCPSD